MRCCSTWPIRQQALRSMAAAVQPGGWLLIEDKDYMTFVAAYLAHPLIGALRPSHAIAADVLLRVAGLRPVLRPAPARRQRRPSAWLTVDQRRSPATGRAAAGRQSFCAARWSECALRSWAAASPPRKSSRPSSQPQRTLRSASWTRLASPPGPAIPIDHGLYGNAVDLDDGGSGCPGRRQTICTLRALPGCMPRRIRLARPGTPLEGKAAGLGYVLRWQDRPVYDGHRPAGRPGCSGRQ